VVLTDDGQRARGLRLGRRPARRSRNNDKVTRVASIAMASKREVNGQGGSNQQ
jgi:hypothetical protein